MWMPLALAVILADTAEPAFADPAAEAVVRQLQAAYADVPAELRDYRAEVRTVAELVLAADTGVAREVVLTRDRFLSEVRWSAEGYLHQRVLAQAVRTLAPVPYTLGSLLESPWIVPHLYGRTLAILAGEGRAGAINPLGADGPRYYRYELGDTLVLRTPEATVRLVPLRVRPRRGVGAGDVTLLVGTFEVDVDRRVVVRARFGASEPGGGLLGRVYTFVELENALRGGRYWLPYRQRREVQVGAAVLGGTLAARLVSTVERLQLNTGWRPTGRRVLLVRVDSAAADPGGEEPAAAWTVDDFQDLRLATAGGAAGGAGGRAAVQLRPERGDHLLRYNRVEGLFLGAGARLLIGPPLERRTELYATAGWAFAEGTARGELLARHRGARVEVGGAAYRRLADLRTFRPTLQWDWLYAAAAGLGGSDRRQYMDVTGAELWATTRRGPWSARLAVRTERQDSVREHTDRYLFGRAPDFPPLVAILPGRHTAVELDLGYARGPGIFALGPSRIVGLRLEAGLGDFRFLRAVGLVSVRQPLGPFTVRGRLDGGVATGEVPPQFLLRFGEPEGLRGAPELGYAGTRAVLARGRFLIPLPPRSERPLLQGGGFLLPPLRPHFVLVGETGRADRTSDALPPADPTRPQPGPTNGAWVGRYGLGLSLFDDALSLEVLRSRGGPTRVYVGFTTVY